MSSVSWGIGSRWNEIGYCAAVKIGVSGGLTSSAFDIEEEEHESDDDDRECEDEPASSST